MNNHENMLKKKSRKRKRNDENNSNQMTLNDYFFTHKTKKIKITNECLNDKLNMNNENDKNIQSELMININESGDEDSDQNDEKNVEINGKNDEIIIQNESEEKEIINQLQIIDENNNNNNVIENEQQNKCNNNEILIKCVKCNKYKQTIYTEEQQKHVKFECNHCNHGNNENIHYYCSYCDKKWVTIKRFIDHYKDKHENNYITNIFKIDRCKNSDCKQWIKTENIIKFKCKGISTNYNGYCVHCRYLLNIDKLKTDKKLGIFDDIDQIYKLQTNVEDFKPKPIIPDLVDLYTFIFNKIIYSNGNDNDYYNKLLMLIPKIILSKPKRNNNNDMMYNIKINLYKRRIKYFRNGDNDGILREIASIIAQRDEYINKKKRKIIIIIIIKKE